MLTRLNAAIEGMVELPNNPQFENYLFKLSYLVGISESLSTEEKEEIFIFLNDLKFHCNNLDLEVKLLKRNGGSE